jgi:hypothetical protein
MTRTYSGYAAWILGLCLGGGIAIAGVYLGESLKESRKPQRVVSVRGLAERDVDADLAVWPITFSETSNDLADLYNRIVDKRKTIAGFLAEAGFGSADISFSAPQVSDQHARENNEDRSRAAFRYLGKATVTVRSSNVPLVKKTIEQSGSLVGKGIVIVGEDWENRTQYLFKGLNTIKPQMIEEATRNARAAAEKFASDSGSKIGKIRSASQGLFEITDRDQGTPDKKQVRVVTSIDYSLVDQ